MKMTKKKTSIKIKEIIINNIENNVDVTIKVTQQKRSNYIKFLNHLKRIIWKIINCFS